MAAEPVSQYNPAHIADGHPDGDPIGIFDSGIGGLSVLQHIHAQLPHENLAYFADSGFAPYGDKPEPIIIDRVFAIAGFLLEHRCKALVAACNTATAAAIHLLRERYADLPIVGIEPGLKPAITLTHKNTVGVLATERTLKSMKFQLLHEQLSEKTNIHFVTQACNGLADLIEQGDLQSPEIHALIQRYLSPLLEQDVDTIVLGCTHYPFVQDVIRQVASEAGVSQLNIIDTGLAVTRQLTRMLEQHGIHGHSNRNTKGTLTAYTTGDVHILEMQFRKLLNLSPAIHPLPVSK